MSTSPLRFFFIRRTVIEDEGYVSNLRLCYNVHLQGQEGHLHSMYMSWIPCDWALFCIFRIKDQGHKEEEMEHFDAQDRPTS